jgi:hypothetical protein
MNLIAKIKVKLLYGNAQRIKLQHKYLVITITSNKKQKSKILFEAFKMEKIVDLTDIYGQYIDNKMQHSINCILL